MSIATTTQSIREEAAAAFERLGWPTTRLEEWKYTSLAPVAKVEWGVDETPLTPDPSPRAAGRGDLTLAGRAAIELVFINGRLAETRGAAPRGVTVANLADSDSEHFARYADYQTNALVALNTANAKDGAFIEIADGTTVDGFIHLLFIGEGDGIWSHPRNLVVAGANSKVTVVETYSGRGSYYTNAVTEIVAGDGAIVDHYKLECESLTAFHTGVIQIQQARSSTVSSCSVSVGGTLVRNEVNAVLAGEGASVVLDGLFVLTGNQHVDNHTVIDHVKPHCTSSELYKGILDESSRGIFDGRIIVRPDAQKTVSRQVNHNLLLSESAIVDSKPTLEILNDDVKCNHGSTIGRLSEESIFYLRSRGIGEDDARNLLLLAFASEIVDRMKVEPVREQIRRALFEQMPDRLPERRDKR